MFASRQTQPRRQMPDKAENRKFSYQRDTRQISITYWKGPISNEPFNHSHPSPTTAAKSVKKHHPGLPGIPRKLHPFERSEIFSEVPIYRERAGARFIRLPPSASAAPASCFTRQRRQALAPTTPVEYALQISPFYAKQTQFPDCSNKHKLMYNKAL